MGCSNFSEYIVIAEISSAKINPLADLNKVCMIGCGVSTGWGAVINNCNMQPRSTVAVWGLGAVGLSVIQVAKIRGASNIYTIDINSGKF
jgi:Zn-dependent alcohol dehydrogenase